jgi:glycosyltransferase involved in cell wall biosynthesis
LTNPLKILMVCHQRRSRSQARSHAMAKYLVQRGHKVSLIVIAELRRVGIVESYWDGVHLIETPDLLWGRLRSGWDLWDLLHRILYLSRDKGPYDLVHCFETRPVTIYPALLYCRHYKIPLVTDWNDWWGRGGLVDINRPRWYRLLFGGVETYYEEAFRKRSVGITVIASALKKRAVGLGVPAERICHIPGGTFPDFFLHRDKAVCRKRMGMPLSAFILGFCSADSHFDLEIVLQSLSIVAERYPAVKLIITGNQDKSIIKLAKSHGVEGNIHLTGFLAYEELPWVLGCADLFVLPFPDKVYNLGRWPNKVCDYMSLGRPTISNPVGDIKTLFENHEIGLLAHWDPEDFAEKIIYLLEHPKTADKLGDNARNLAVTVYDWKILIRRLEEFYYRLLSTTLNKDDLPIPPA